MTGRAGVRAPQPGDEKRGKRLFAQLADVTFYCEVCHGSHPLREHRRCRQLGHQDGQASPITDEEEQIE